MSTSNSKVVVDYEGDLCSSLKPILFLGFLLPDADFLLELGTLDDLLQSRSNIRVQHLEVWKIRSTN